MEKKKTKKETYHKVMWDGSTWFVSEDKTAAIEEGRRIHSLHPYDKFVLRTITTTQTDEPIELTQKSNNEQTE